MFSQVHLNVMFSAFELSTNGSGNRLNLSTIKDISCENADVLLPKLLSSVVFSLHVYVIVSFTRPKT